MGSHSRTNPLLRRLRGRRAGFVVGSLLVAAVLGAGAAFGAGLFNRSGRSPAPHAASPTRVPSQSAVPTKTGFRAVDDALPATAGAGPCTRVRVAASLEDHDLITALVRAYHGERRNVAGHCVSIDATANRSGLLLGQATAGFPASPDTAKPDVWWPDSSAWLSLARVAQAAKGAPHTVPEQGTSVARTPIVLAMPATQAAALGWDRTPPRWRDYVDLSAQRDVWRQRGHPEWGAFKLGKTSPQMATAGLYGLVAAYEAIAGHVGALDSAEVGSASVRAAVHASERATVHYGASEEHFLWHARGAEQTGTVTNFLSAVTVEEKATWDYDRGLISKDGLVEQHLGPPKTPLVPVYPADGTFVADNPAAVLDGSWVRPAARAAANDLIRFARTVQGQAVVRASGYRDLGDMADPDVAQVGHYRSAPPRTLASPAGDVLAAVQDSFLAVRKRARVLFAVDLSGSMNAPLPDGRTRLQAAQQATIRALPYFAGDDQVGLAGFSNLPGRQTVTPGIVDPVGPLAAKRAALPAKIDALALGHQTPLYRAVPQFVAAMARGYRDDEINAIVVLSDGKNDTDAAGTPASLRQQVTASTKDKPIRVFTLAYGADADKPALEEIAKLTGAHFYDASDPSKLGSVLGDLVTNF